MSSLAVLSLAVSAVSAAATQVESSASGTQTSNTTFSGGTTASGAAASGAGGAGARAGGAPGGGPGLDPYDLVFRIDLVLLMVFGVFALTTLPRLLSTLSTPSHSLTGFFLRGRSSGDFVGQPARDYTAREPTSFYKGMGIQSSSTFSHSNESFGSRSNLVTTPRGGTRASGVAPPRVRSWLAWTHPAIGSILHYEVWPGVSFGKAIILLGYFGLLLFAGFYNSNVFTDYKREGYVAMSQFPVIVALATKNNVLTWTSGVGYEKLNYIHRFAGKLMVLAANIHGIGYIWNWAVAGTFSKEIAIPKYTWGLIATASLDLLYLGSMEPVRKKSYSFFLASHVTGFALLSAGMCLHYPILVPYVVAGLSVYGLDVLLRIIRTRATMGYVTAHVGLNGQTTHVHLPEITKGWRAGQHVRVRFVDPSSGAFGWLTAALFARTRPYSISSKPNSSGLELLIKTEGATTKQLFDLASSVSTNNDKEAQPASRRVNALIEGPYSGPAYTMFESYSGVLLAAGGSGISYILSILEDLVQKHIDGHSRVRIIEIIWSVGDFESLLQLLPTLRPLLRPHLSPEGVLLSIQMTVHYTRATLKRPPDATTLPDCVCLRPGRPDMVRSMKSTVDRTLDATTSGSTTAAYGVIATCCGPTALAGSMNEAIGHLDWSQWSAVGGVETASEYVPLSLNAAVDVEPLRHRTFGW
ncbi:hypothetical protein K488DRAFT_44902 [Vararia minispora EC-137]|uniref:Uncharacterized protein n=1 Tax=Vararia minispora EC-137 TaxID=1314806 RepID=A0ACB8QTF2_9AGAM|nr:hypothetical protein K488DRAFT_44902 [Vararia minispora EC-137]